MLPVVRIVRHLVLFGYSPIGYYLVGYFRQLAVGYPRHLKHLLSHGFLRQQVVDELLGGVLPRFLFGFLEGFGHRLGSFCPLLRQCLSRRFHPLTTPYIAFFRLAHLFGEQRHQHVECPLGVAFKSVDDTGVKGIAHNRTPNGVLLVRRQPCDNDDVVDVSEYFSLV